MWENEGRMKVKAFNHYQKCLDLKHINPENLLLIYYRYKLYLVGFKLENYINLAGSVHNLIRIG